MFGLVFEDEGRRGGARPGRSQIQPPSASSTATDLMQQLTQIRKELQDFSTSSQQTVEQLTTAVERIENIFGPTQPQRVVVAPVRLPLQPPVSDIEEEATVNTKSEVEAADKDMFAAAAESHGNKLGRHVDVDAVQRPDECGDESLGTHPPSFMHELKQVVSGLRETDEISESSTFRV